MGQWLQKEDKLLQLLATEEVNPSLLPGSLPRSLVFVARKAHCEELVLRLRGEGYSAGALHGDKSQAMRSAVMERFRNGRLDLLVATDVASRGLDVKVR